MITFISILFLYSLSVVISRPLIKRIINKNPIPPHLEFAARVLPYFPFFNTFFLLDYLKADFKSWLCYRKAKREVNKLGKKYGWPPFDPQKNKAKTNTNSRRQWFRDRVGKRVFRNPNGCFCNRCASVVNSGMIINDVSHADYLYENEAEYNIEGTPLRYFDTKEEVKEWTKTHVHE